jgi:hypothetical protein
MRGVRLARTSHPDGPAGQSGMTPQAPRELTMDARFGYYGNDVAAKFAKYLNSAGAVVTQSALPAVTQERHRRGLGERGQAP